MTLLIDPDEQFILNKNNIRLQVFKWTYKVGQKPHLCYGCTQCFEFFVSKNGALEHICSPQTFKYDDYVNYISSYSTTFNKASNLNAIKHYFTTKNIVYFIATTNLPINKLKNNFIRNALSCLDPSYIIPSYDKLRQLVIDEALRIEQRNLRSLYGKIVSLLLDEATRWNTHYEGVVIYTPERLYFMSVTPIPGLKANYLAHLTSYIVKKLQSFGITVVSVCTDNAGNNKKAYDEKNPKCAEALSNQQFIRQPCSAHTANLGINDMFGNDPEYGYIIGYISQLLISHPYKKGPVPNFTIRWSSMFKCVEYIYENLEYYKSRRDPVVQEHLERIKTDVGWDNLLKMVKYAWDFIENIEGDHVSIANIFPSIKQVWHYLLEMNTRASIKFANIILHRFCKTVHLKLPLFAFSLTQEGLDWFRNYPGNSFLNDSIEGMKIYAKDRNIQHIDVLLEMYDLHLSTCSLNDFNAFSLPIEFWKAKENNTNESLQCRLFAKFAVEVLSIPASEAAVERIFASLSALIDSREKRCKPDLINAKLCIKYDVIFEKAREVQWEELESETNRFKEIAYKFNFY